MGSDAYDEAKETANESWEQNLTDRMIVDARAKLLASNKAIEHGEDPLANTLMRKLRATKDMRDAFNVIGSVAWRTTKSIMGESLLRSLWHWFKKSKDDDSPDDHAVHFRQMFSRDALENYRKDFKQKAADSKLLNLHGQLHRLIGELDYGLNESEMVLEAAIQRKKRR